MKYSKITIYALAAALGALVVGLNLGGISGAIDIIERNFGLTTFSKGFVTSALMVGCLFGAFIGGSLSDRYGRRPVMMASAILLLLSSSGCSLLSFNATHLVIFRLIGGLGVGMLSAVIPTYIAEISPAAYRGTFISFYQVFVVIGIFIAYICNYWFFGMDSNWKLMLGLPIAFAILYIVFLIGIPESPRWLVQCDRQDDAKSSIKTLCFGPEDTEDILNSANGNKNEEVAFPELFKGKTGKVVFLGCMLAFFQQITGINVVINYAPSIFSSLDIAGSDPLLQTIYVGAANLVFTLIALWLVDKFPRKILLVTGCIGCAIALAYLVYAFGAGVSSSIGVLIAILAYIGFFALSLSPLMFVVTSEMYPSRIRGTAMALSTAISWICSFIVVQLYPWVEANVGPSVAFGIFSTLLVAAALFISFLIPETKGKTLEQIQKELKID